jgi:trehalose 6-phosphate synthase
MRDSIESQVGRINGQFSRVGHPVVHYLHQSVGRDELIALYRAADVMVVTPLRDGMNLVCKEYVASRHGLDGTLVLSEFAGAAAELTSALLVNPHDLDGVKNALLRALTMDPAEEHRRMRVLRRQVLTHDVNRWARHFLAALGPQTTSHASERHNGGNGSGSERENVQHRPAPESHDEGAREPDATLPT